MPIQLPDGHGNQLVVAEVHLRVASPVVANVLLLLLEMMVRTEDLLGLW